MAWKVRLRSRPHIYILWLLVLLSLTSCSTLLALSPSSTTLTLSTTTAPVDTPIRLDAAVVQNSLAVTTGTVTFLSTTVPGTPTVLGTVTVAGFRPASNHATGVATLWMKFGVGSYTITAKFAGTSTIPPSTSGSQHLNVTGWSPSFTSIAATPNGFNFDLTASVLGSGFSPVVGTVALADRTIPTSFGNVTLSGPRTAFRPQSAYDTGKTPRGVAIGDLNGDGIPDVVAANSGTADVSILLSDPNNRGVLFRQFKQAAGNGAAAVAIADLNGDGAPDIAVVNSTDGTVSVILSNGVNPGAEFAPQVVYAVGRAPAGIVVGDVNGDGIYDLVVANSADSSVSVLLGDSANPGGFLPAVTYATGLAPVSLALGDWTGDGVLDIAVANSGEKTISILPGDAAHLGQFLNKLSIAVSEYPTTLAAADLNNDQCLDLAVLFSSKGTLGVLLQDVAHPGQFLPQQTYPVGAQPSALAASDLNNDTFLDLLVTNSGDNSVSTLLSDQAHRGQFLSPQNYAVGIQPSAIVAADLNGDGVPDLIVTNAASNTVSVLLGGTMSQGLLANVALTGIGPHTIQASYATGAVYTLSSGTTTATVTPVATNTTLTATVDGQALPPSRIVGSAQVLTLLAAFTPATANGVNANGTVSFMDGAAPIAACSTTFAVDGNGNGIATCSPTLGSGAHTLKANFNAISGGHFASSTSTAIPLTVVLLTASNLILSGPPTALAGRPGQYTVVVTDQLSKVVTGFTGTVHFASGDTNAVLPADYTFNTADAGRFAFPITFSTGGAQALTVSTTTGALVSTTQPVLVSVNSSTTLAVSSPNALLGQAITLTAKVAAGSIAVPVGTVTFLDGARRLGSAQLVGISPAAGFTSGSAQLRVRLGIGSHAIFADFEGIHTVLPSASDPQSVVIEGAEPTTTILSTLPNGANYDFSATVSGLGAADPAGMMSFTDTTANLSLGSVAVMSTSAQQSYLPASYVGAGILSSLIAGDLNGDGIPDIAAVSPLDNKFAVMLGDPATSGSLLSPAMYSVGTNPVSITMADCNADGVPDLLVANSNDGTVSVLRGTGDGSFQQLGTVAVGNHPASIAIGDWNLDGDLDVVVANSTDKTVSVLMGNGDCTFQPRKNYSVGNTPTAVIGVDVNGDGVADLVVANSDDSTISALVGKGDGTFLPAAVYPVGSYPIAIVAADFNSDGFEDLAILNRDSMFISVLLGKGDGSFLASTPVALDHKAVSFALSQPTLAGTRNLMIANGDGASFTSLPSNGDGSFRAAVDTVLGFVPGSIALSDWNGDGQEDALLASASGPDLVLAVSAISIAAQVSDVPLLGLGLHTVLASYAPGPGVPAAASTSNTLALAGGLGAQYITFAALPPVAYGSPPESLYATSNASLDVAFSVVSGPCSMSGNSLTVAGAGQCVIGADQAGNASYAPAPSVLQTLVVTPASLTVTADPFTRAFGSTNPLFTGTLSGLVNGDGITAIYASAANQLTDSGVYSVGVNAIHATLSDASGRAGNYSTTLNLGALTISRAPQTISFSALPPTNYSASPISLNASSGSSLAILYTIVSGPGRIAGTTLITTGAGIVTLQADQSGGSNYLAALPALQSITVNQAQLSVTPNAASRSFGVPNPLFSGTLSGLIVGDVITATYASAASANTPMGIYSSGPNAITATLVDANNRLANYIIVPSQGTLTITQATQVITFPALAATTYGAGAVRLIASATSALPVSFRVLSGPGIVSESTLTPTGAGLIILEADQVGNSTFPAAAPVQQSVMISKAQLSVSPNSETRAVGAPNPVFTGVLSGVVASDNITATYNSLSNTSTPIGIYSTASNGITSALFDPAARMSNYVVVQNIGTLTITQPTQSITFLPLSSVIYSNIPLSLNAFASSGLRVSYRILSGPATVSGSTVTYTGAGTVVIEADQGGDLSFPAANPVQQSLVINRAKLLVTPSPASRVYGIGNPAFVGSIAGAIPGDILSATYSSTASAGSPVGSYTILATMNDPNNKASSYDVSVATAVLTITKTTLTVSADNRKQAYGLPISQLTGVVSGAYSGDAVTVLYSTLALITSPPGLYPITIQVQGADPASYTLTTKPATLTITRADANASLKLSSQTAGAGTSVMVTAAVASTTTGVPSGTITFFDSQAILGASSPDALGQAVLSPAGFAPGTHSVTAAYSGDVNFNPATTSIATLVIGVPDYGVTSNAPTLTISPGQSAFVQLSITPVFGFKQPFTYSCGPLPTYMTCQFTPGAVTPDGTSITPVQLTVSVATTTSWLKGSSSLMLATIVPLSLIGLIPLSRSRQRWRFLVGIVFLSMAITGLIVGCGGGGVSASQPVTPPPSTAPSGTQIVNITVTSGAMTHQLPLTIIIKGA